MHKDDHSNFQALIELIYDKNCPSHYAKKIDHAITTDSLYHEHFRFLPMLYRYSQPRLLSETAWKKCRSAYKHTYYRNLLQLDRAAKIQKWLEDNFPSPFIVLKGISLLLSAYPHLGERPMSDIDFLVPHFVNLRDYQIAEYLHEQSFFISSYSGVAITLKDQQQFEYDMHRYVHSFALSSTVNELIIENSQHVRHKQYEFNIPCPEHQLVHVIYHGKCSPNTAYSKRWIVDCIQLLKNKPLKAQQIATLAKAVQFPVIVKQGLKELETYARFFPHQSYLLQEVNKEIIAKSKWLTKIVLLNPAPDQGNAKPASRLDWLKRLLVEFIIVPIKLRNNLSLKAYYRYKLCLTEPSNNLVKEVIRRFLIRVRFLMWGNWIRTNHK